MYTNPTFHLSYTPHRVFKACWIIGVYERLLQRFMGLKVLLGCLLNLYTDWIFCSGTSPSYTFTYLNCVNCLSTYLSCACWKLTFQTSITARLLVAVRFEDLYLVGREEIRSRIDKTVFHWATTCVRRAQIHSKCYDI